MFFGVFLLPTIVHAAEESEGYNAIVDELKSSLNDEKPIKKDVSEPAHVEVGGAIVGDYVQVGGGSSGSVMLTGFDFHIAFDLLTPTWVTEGSYRSFGTSQINKTSSASAQELDFKLIHKSQLPGRTWLRIGGGLSAQTLRTTTGTEEGPAAILLLGIDKTLTARVSIGPDVSLHLPISSNSDERGSGDASMRLSFHF